MKYLLPIMFLLLIPLSLALDPGLETSCCFDFEENVETQEWGEACNDLDLNKEKCDIILAEWKTKEGKFLEGSKSSNKEVLAIIAIVMTIVVIIYFIIKFRNKKK